MQQQKKRLLVSVSGGRTSAVMAYLLWTRYRDKYEMLFVFANTSREDDRTLDFVKALTDNFGIPIVWVQAVVHFNKRKSCTHEVVTYETADREGNVFERVIMKYGIPNKAFPHCTRELKKNPIEDYARNGAGWKAGSYTTVIGYRKDEPKRVNLLSAAKKKQWYPLWEWGITKPDVAVFWKGQSFDLQIEDWEGNCILCHKKSDRKLFTTIQKHPSSTVWVRRMEVLHGHIHPMQYKGPLPFFFFRGYRGIEELIELSKEPFNPSTDKSLDTTGAEYDYELDEQESCAESCEPW